MEISKIRKASVYMGFFMIAWTPWVPATGEIITGNDAKAELKRQYSICFGDKTTLAYQSDLCEAYRNGYRYAQLSQLDYSTMNLPSILSQQDILRKLSQEKWGQFQGGDVRPGTNIYNWLYQAPADLSR